MPKPKQWSLAKETDKFHVWRYEAPEAAESALWIEIRWSIRRELFMSWRSNAAQDDGESWTPFLRPIKNHAVAKRQAFEAITWLAVPLAEVHKVEEASA